MSANTSTGESTKLSRSVPSKSSKDALLEARKKLETFDIPTNNALLSEIEDHRKPNLLEFVLHKLKRFTQTFSKKKFVSRLLEKDKVDNIIKNLLKNPDYDLETYEILKKRSQEMEEEDLKQQLNHNKEFIATQEDRRSKIFLTLENAKKKLL